MVGFDQITLINNLISVNLKILLDKLLGLYIYIYYNYIGDYKFKLTVHTYVYKLVWDLLWSCISKDVVYNW